MIDPVSNSQASTSSLGGAIANDNGMGRDEFLKLLGAQV
jgi:hypothetical protein